MLRTRSTDLDQHLEARKGWCGPRGSSTRVPVWSVTRNLETGHFGPSGDLRLLPGLVISSSFSSRCVSFELNHLCIFTNICNNIRLTYGSLIPPICCGRSTHSHTAVPSMQAIPSLFLTWSINPKNIMIDAKKLAILDVVVGNLDVTKSWERVWRDLKDRFRQYRHTMPHFLPHTYT